MTEMLVLPFYVVVDVSYSMTMIPKNLDGTSAMSALASGNEIVKKVKIALEGAPILADKVRFSLIDFSDDAQVLIPMNDLLKIPPSSIPDLAARGGTSFAAAFSLLRRQIPIDVAQLKGDGHKVHRPAVFFLTDGEPTDTEDEWRSAFLALTDESFRERPNFIPFGVSDAKKEILDQLAYPPKKMHAFVTAQGQDAATAITSMAEILISSVLASAASIHSDGESGGFVLPEDDEDGVWL